LYARVMAISTCAGPVGGSVVSLPYDRHVNLIVRVRDPPLAGLPGRYRAGRCRGAGGHRRMCRERPTPDLVRGHPYLLASSGARGGDADLQACSARTWWEVRRERATDPLAGPSVRVVVPTERPGGRQVGWLARRETTAKDQLSDEGQAMLPSCDSVAEGIGGRFHEPQPTPVAIPPVFIANYPEVDRGGTVRADGCLRAGGGG
jgi:hypothetical protein